MSGPVIGALFAGYSGLELGTQAVFGGRVAWHSEIDKGANAILGHHYPDIPNHGDITAIDWAEVEPVDILTGGFPCQDLSTAGNRAGLRPGTRSGLWNHFAYAISQLRPGKVVIENVRGLLNAQAHSDVEPCAWCVGDPPDSPLRALGAVLGDLARIGYDAQWHGLRASDLGAPHGRFRVFIVATDTTIERHLTPAPVGLRAGDDHAPGDLRRDGVTRLPTPQAIDHGFQPTGLTQRLASGKQIQLGHAVGALLPTPSVNDMGAGKTLDWWDEWAPRQKSATGRKAVHGRSLAIEATRVSERLLPTPKATNNENRSSGPDWPPNLGTTLKQPGAWGIYIEAVTTWGALVGRPAPPPMIPSPLGLPRLSPLFVEWMMGLPAGWVTDVPGLSHSAMLKALGNGVMPQQAAAALAFLEAAS